MAGDGSGDFLQLQVAVTAAIDGDVILVRPHTERYDFTVINGKSLTIVGEGAVRPEVEDVRVINLPAGKVVTLRFLDIEGRAEPDILFGAIQRPGLTLASNDGCVWLQDLVIVGGSGIANWGSFEAGWPALLTNDADCMVVVDSAFEGGPGFWSVAGTSDPGGDGGQLSRSRAALHGTTFVGGLGGQGIAAYPGQGGIGLDSSGTTVFASGSSLAGGDSGADTGAVPPQFPSATGLVARNFSIVKHLATSFAAGGGPAPPGAPMEIEASSSVRDLHDVHRAIQLPAVVRETAEAQVTYSGRPGDLVLLRISPDPGWSFVASLKGVQHLDAVTADVLLGAVGPSGTLDVTFRAPRLAPGIDATTAYAQPLVAETGGALRLGGPSSSTIVDASIPRP